MMIAKKKKTKKKKKKHILHIELGHGGKLLQKYEFLKCRVSEKSEEKYSMFDIFVAYFAHFCIGAFFADKVELTKHIPLYSYFS